MTETPTGRPCWFELLTNDRNAAIDFYQTVFGWGASDFRAGERPYTLWLNGDAPIGGGMDMPASVPKGVPPHWLTYVSTPDLDAFVAKAKELGGAILNRLDISDVGLIAIVGDPAGGGCFAAFQPYGSAPGHDGEARLGEVSWLELATDDIGKAWNFYSELCAWRETNRGDMGPAGAYLMFGRGEVELGGMYKRPAEAPAPSWLNYFRVEDARRSAELVSRHGGRIVNGPMEVPGDDWVAMCQDPQGANFAVHSKH